MFEKLKTKDIILASNSPRRKALLAELNVPFSVKIFNDIDESYPDDVATKDVAKFLALKKADAINRHSFNESTLIITADTIVCINNKLLGKPNSYEEAFRMLSSLSGQSHEVITGVALTSMEKQIAFSTSTKVYFGKLTEEEINYYIYTYQPYDKAGAYGIQEWIGMAAVEKIEGSYYNVMGLPIHRLYREIVNF
jgi:septum formation protein